MAEGHREGGIKDPTVLLHKRSREGSKFVRAHRHEF